MITLAMIIGEWWKGKRIRKTVLRVKEGVKIWGRKGKMQMTGASDYVASGNKKGGRRRVREGRLARKQWGTFLGAIQTVKSGGDGPTKGETLGGFQRYLQKGGKGKKLHLPRALRFLKEAVFKKGRRAEWGKTLKRMGVRVG